MMMREIPLPIPFSVILSPSHITKTVPAIRMTIDVNQNWNGETSSGLVTEIIAEGTCALRFTI
jgi:hypothetical protein